MKHYYLYIALILFSACSITGKEVDSRVTGTVVNKHSKIPIEGVTVKITDGDGAGSILGSNETPQAVSTITDVNGQFSLELTSESPILGVTASKENYEMDTDGVDGLSLGQGSHSVTVEMNGFTEFDGFFLKNSGPENSTDTLYLGILSYERLDENLYNLSTREKVGVGPFEFIVAVNGSASVYGDAYLRYKLVHKSEGIWKTVIDSIFLPMSAEVYRDTIYY
jgi:hypothetical protein